MVLLFVFCSVSYLLIWHGYLVAGNVTTIEYFQVSDEIPQALVAVGL